MENITDRYERFLEIKGLNDNKVTVKAGLSGGLLGKARLSRKGFHSDTIEKILYAYEDLNPVWFVMGKGEPLIEDIKIYPEVFHPVGDIQEPNKVFKLKTDKIYPEQRIPLYNIEASAGVVSLFTSIEDSEVEPVGYLSIPNLPKCDGSMHITGDSMYPLLKSGDIVAYKIIEAEYDNIFFGEMYIVSMMISGDPHLSVKWIQKSEKGENYITLVSENRHHPPKDVHLSKVKALALVKASVRINSMS